MMINVLLKYKDFHIQIVKIASVLAIIAGFLSTFEIAEQVSIISSYLLSLSVITMCFAGGFVVCQLIEITYIKLRRDSSLLDNCNIVTVENYLIGLMTCAGLVSVLALMSWMFTGSI
ncbi:hypothetical protein BM526_19195 (plasmid) [Alteromonas mediterranea]|uniref:hypothetical protein n=1 Tax=Alteromonas mediterranea TaxID=314275 RepID=UPI000903FC10|nr:hypothetical protein [Alteromonas mediterranea]APE04096.1 hypothetical protein BM526_19195 [Alteromonas mediterranea]